MQIKKPSGEVRTLPIQVIFANQFISRFRGLMFQRKLPENEALLLAPCNSIHMFFMFFPIDALFLDENGQIVKIVHHLKPWSLVWPVRQAYMVLEMPAGAATRYGILPGDTLQLKETGLQSY